MITPIQAYEITIGRRIVDPTNDMLEFIRFAPAKDLQEFILLSREKSVASAFNLEWIEQAKHALPVRIAEEAAQSANKLIQHTEQLTKQTDTHIQHSEKLTHQTDKLITESVSLTALTKQLKFWTIILGVFAVVQIIIMVFDYLKHK